MLREAIARTPIPTSPPPSDPYREALGLNLLSLALRLDHVDRLSEAVHLVDSTHLTRSIAIDVNLARLPRSQLQALRTTAELPDPQQPRPATIWLPLARHARTDLAPILVRDAVGAVLTTNTHRATVRSLSQGLRRAFLVWLESSPDAHAPGHLLRTLRHDYYRSSWLIEAALASLVEHGGPDPDSRRYPFDDGRAKDAADIRQTAQNTVEALFGSDSSPFLRLLEMVSSQHLLVAEIRTEHDHQFLRYDAPVLPALPHTGRHLPQWIAGEREFTVTYQTVIPRAVNSYHVTVEVPEEIRVRHMIMVSDNDAHSVQLLVDDMRALAARHQSLRDHAPQVLELELQRIVSQAVEIGRRRHGDLESYKAYVRAWFRTFTSRAPRFRRPPDQPANAREIFASLSSGDRIVERLFQLGEMQESNGRLGRLADTLDTVTLERWAAQIEEADLDLDLYVNNDPRENAGHNHWRRRAFGSAASSAEPVTAKLYAALVDDPPSLAASVGRLLLSVVGLIVALAAFRGLGVADIWGAVRDAWHGEFDLALHSNDPQPIGTADALVTILLLVPGLMLSRLEIPSHRTVLGRLRLASRNVAYAAVTVSIGLALAVATRPSTGLAGPVAAALALLAVIVAVVLVDGAIKAYKRRSRVPNNDVVPRWLLNEIRHPRSRRGRSAVEFSTIGRGSRV